MPTATENIASSLRRHFVVMAGLDPAIHVLPGARKTWMPATSSDKRGHDGAPFRIMRSSWLARA
jgi:hypothetical protein